MELLRDALPRILYLTSLPLVDLPSPQHVVQQQLVAHAQLVALNNTKAHLTSKLLYNSNRQEQKLTCLRSIHLFLEFFLLLLQAMDLLLEEISFSSAFMT